MQLGVKEAANLLNISEKSVYRWINQGLLSPTVRAHIHLLSRLSFALRDEGFKAAINRQARREKIIGEAARIERTFITSQTETVNG